MLIFSLLTLIKVPFHDGIHPQISSFAGFRRGCRSQAELRKLFSASQSLLRRWVAHEAAKSCWFSFRLRLGSFKSLFQANLLDQSEVSRKFYILVVPEITFPYSG
jgi:hypothetical protein